MIGRQFHRLTVLRESQRIHERGPLYLCHCECGNETTVLKYCLLRGTTRSCGCLKRELASARRRTHGGSKTKEYRAWSGMKVRCYNKAHHAYHYYGGRGIKVCDRWQDFVNFIADMGQRPTKCSIERIDNDGDYSPENCRWATDLEQQSNRRNSTRIPYNGKTYTVAALGRLLEIPQQTFHRWIRLKGMSVEQAIALRDNRAT